MHYFNMLKQEIRGRPSPDISEAEVMQNNNKSKYFFINLLLFLNLLTIKIYRFLTETFQLSISLLTFFKNSNRKQIFLGYFFLSIIK